MILKRFTYDSKNPRIWWEWVKSSISKMDTIVFNSIFITVQYIIPGIHEIDGDEWIHL